jgi:two-component system NtrC family sensor kinase
MKKALVILLLTLVSFTETIAQNNLSPIYEIRMDTAFEQSLDNTYWQLLEDKDGKWGIEQVSTSPLSHRFHDSLNTIKSIDTTVQTYWFRYRLKNSMSHEAKVALDARSAQVDFFVSRTGGKWIHFVTGYSYPWNKKDGLKNGNYIPLILEPAEELAIFQRISNSDPGLPKQFKIGFVSTEKATQMELAQYDSIFSKQLYSGKFYLAAIYFGIILFTALFNFFFFLIAHEKQYLYFSLFLFCLFFGNNPLFSETFSREHQGWALLINGGSALFIFFFFQFIRHYFQTYRHTPKWDKLLFVSSISTLYLAFISIYSAIHPDIMSNILILLFFYIINAVSILAVLFTIFFYIRKNTHANRLFITAILPFILLNSIGIIGYIISQLFNLHFPRIDAWVDDWFDLLITNAILWMVLFFSWILFRRYDDQKKQIAKQALDKERLAKEKETERAKLIEKQKMELETTVEERTAELKHSLENLQSTQKQLIQSEKMASLGELTAGIAHEIQNPLNFMNNFSEVNSELIDEMQLEMDNGNLADAKAISNDIKDNEQKINHHGKRADAIVKGMLQHSRSSTGVKESTDLNALADEYLLLAYHGVRAKDKSFNAILKTDFDERIGKINIIPQDIGRVLLNLYNNAFYAMGERRKVEDIGYEPTVFVNTKKSENSISISVRDNGSGIPQKVVDKIFQPFFTTKPTGQGTGLGLSLSFDIIKAHGGEIKVEAKEGEGTTFIVQLQNDRGS